MGNLMIFHAISWILRNQDVHAIGDGVKGLRAWASRAASDSGVRICLAATGSGCGSNRGSAPASEMAKTPGDGAVASVQAMNGGPSLKPAVTG